MKYAPGWPALLILLGFTPAAPAQLIAVPSPYTGATYSAGGFDIGFGRHGRHAHLSAYLSGGSGYYAPYYGYPVYPTGVSRVTVVQVLAPPVVIGVQPAVAAAPAPPRPRLE